jgi:small subunit ribosomal protein S13
MNHRHPKLPKRLDPIFLDNLTDISLNQPNLPSNTPEDEQDDLHGDTVRYRRLSNVPSISSIARPSSLRHRHENAPVSYVNSIPLIGTRPIGIELTKIFGVSIYSAHVMCQAINVSPHSLVQQLTPAQLNKLTTLSRESIMTETDLRRSLSARFKRLVVNGSVRGIRHRRGRPVRGQRTSTNASTARHLNPRRLGYFR